MIVSEVGRTTSGSVSATGAGRSLPSASALQPVMRDHRAFLGEAFHVLRFLREVAERNEEREVGVLVAGGLEHRIELPLHVFPDAVAPGLDHHAAAHVGVLGQIRRADDLLIPFGKIFVAARRDRGLGNGSGMIGHKAGEITLSIFKWPAAIRDARAGCFVWEQEVDTPRPHP